MGGKVSAPEAVPSESKSADINSLSEEDFKQKVRESAETFKSMVTENKVMMVSATYCPHCTVAKRTFDDIGTKYGVVEVNKFEGGEMLMSVVTAVTGSRTVPQIFICGQAVPGGGSGLKQLATSGQLTDILKQCCDGDATCARYNV